MKRKEKWKVNLVELVVLAKERNVTQQLWNYSESND